MKILGYVFFLFATALMAKTGIATGSQSGTYIQIGKDMAKYCQNVPLEVYESKGSLENFYRITKDSKDVTFIMTQFDLLKYMEHNHNPHARKIKMVYPLYNEELHIIVRADAEIRSLKDFNGKKVVVGPGQSGTWLTASLIQQEGNYKWIAIRTDLVTGIKKLLNEEVDAVFMIAGVPTKSFNMLSTEEMSRIKIASISDPVLDKLYGKNRSTIPANTYPFQKNDVHTYAVQSIIAASESNKGSSSYDLVQRLYQCLQEYSETLKTEGHAKWKEVDFKNHDKVGWNLHPAIEEILKTEVR